MEQISFDLAKISQETFELNTSLHGLSPFQEDLSQEDIVESGPQVFLNQTKGSSVGLIYNIEKSDATFCLRMKAVEDIDQVLLNLDEDLKTLNILRADDGRDIQAFRTPNLSLAEVIVDQLANRRFPLMEDMVCKISDPGFHWWYQAKEDGFRLNYGAHRGKSKNSGMSIGPLGDRNLAGNRLNGLVQILMQQQLLIDCRCGDDFVEMRFAPNARKVCESFHKLFECGEFDSFENIFPRSLDGKTLYVYLRELAGVRQFWIGIEEILLNPTLS